MEQVLVNEINQKLNDRSSLAEDHIGIYNVNQRIKIVFGKEYGVLIESRKNFGTSVIIRIPLVNLQ